MSPLEHGEVFVLDDGGEVDLDLGTCSGQLSGLFTKSGSYRKLREISANISRKREQYYYGQDIPVSDRA